MKIQNQIKRTLSHTDNINYIKELIASNPFMNRNALAKAVCEYYGLYDARGESQISGCLKAVRQLEKEGHFILPKGRSSTRSRLPQRLNKPVETVQNVPEKVAAQRAEAPGQSYSSVAKGDWPATKAYYRMIDQPEESAVNMENILLPHRTRTIRRMQGQNTVLCIQDGSKLNYNNLDKCSGLGEIGSNQTTAKSRGLNLHSTFVVAPNGLPLGVLKATCEAPKSKSTEETRASNEIPIEEKKTFIWIEHHRDMVEVAAKMPETRLINVCDREADFAELFIEQRQNPRVELLVRAKHNRTIDEEPGKLFAAVAQSQPQSTVRVVIPRQSARPKKSKQKARPKSPGRTAELSIRYLPIQLRSPSPDTEPIDIWVIHALEENPPPNTEPAEWYLLTTLNITSSQIAEQCLLHSVWYSDPLTIR